MPNLDDASLQSLLNELLAQGQQLGAGRDPRADALEAMLKQRGYSSDTARMRPGAVIGPESDESALEGFVTRYADTPATDGETADYYGDNFDEYANFGRPTSPKQRRNREIMGFDPNDDLDVDPNDVEAQNPASRGMVRSRLPEDGVPSTEDELDMVQRNLGPKNNNSDEDDGLTGNEQEDLDFIRGLMEDGEPLNGLDGAFERRYGYPPEL